MNQSASLSIKGYPFPVYSLLVWKDQSLLRNLMYGLKGGEAKETFQGLAWEFLSRYQNAESVPHLALLIPAPTLEKKGYDHANSWGEALSQIAGIPVVQGLTKGDSRPQKQLAREERFQKKLFLSKALKIEIGTRIIFVDDLVTTGATAMAAYLALGKPSAFEVWTIGCRPPRFLL